MYKSISILTLALTAMTAAPTINTTPGGASSKAILYFRFGAADNEQNEMSVTINNVTGAKARFTLEMYDGKGGLVEVPYWKGNGTAVRLPRLTEDVEPNGSRVYGTDSSGMKLQRGWLRVISEPAGAIAVSAIGRTAMNGKDFQQMFTLNQQTSAPVQHLARFDNGSTDHLVVANNSDAPDMLTLVARKLDGTEMCSATLPMPARNFYKHFVKSYLSCTDGKSATLEVRSETGASVAMAFVYPAQGNPIALEPQSPRQGTSEVKLEDQLQEIYNKLKKAAGY